jgi:amino acid adenylation domain-containing protein
VDGPDRAIGDYSLLSPAARPLLPDPSAAMVEPPCEPITTTFFSQAARDASATAVCQGARTWTYGDLAGAVSALEGTLRAHGHREGDVVAVTGTPSFGIVASLLAVLAAGGVLLPIDPDLPAERQRLTLHEAAARRVIDVASAAETGTVLLEIARCPVVRVDAGTGTWVDARVGEAADAAPRPSTTPPGAAYIFFTSGTTATPNGVIGSNKGLAHFLAWQRERFEVAPGDRCAQLTNLSVDGVLRDVFLPLVSGATLCLPESPLYGADVLTWVDRERVTLLHAVPVLVTSWLTRSVQPISLRTVRHVFFTGEPLSDALVRRWREAFPESGEIVNLYGATEATLAQCSYIVPADPLPGVQSAGTALPDFQALVLDDARRLRGIGERGEIALRSPFLSLGYVNAEAKGRSSFVQNPFRDDPDDRLFLTGDVGRYCPDGTLDILGRLDDQVEIRGVRVELGEVNAQLLEHPSVTSSCVVARRDELGVPAIVAYLVSSDPEAASDRHLRAFLSRRLPWAMVPSAFVHLAQLPLILGGKVDRRALPAAMPFRAATAHNQSASPIPVVPATTSASDPIERCATLSDADVHRVLIEWNDTAAEFPRDRCLHELVEAQVTRTPTAIALVCGENAISYERLNARANQLARVLRARGVGPDVPVGVCLERSIELVVGLLGILKAGGAYVPLDPTYPNERLRMMLEDSGARVLVTGARLATRLRSPAVDAVCLDASRALIASERDDNLEASAAADDLAYVIFTSGSTGRPKGVMISHRAICNHMYWMQTAFPLTPDDRVLQRTACSFDASVWEFYAPLVAGACLILAPAGGRFDPRALVEAIGAHRVSILQLVPAMLALVLEECDLSACASLRRVFCGGEPLGRELQERFFERLEASLHNLYGPTEACIDAVYWTCSRTDARHTVPIGRPIANTQVYVLNPDRKPAPIGVDGELYIGGAGLARGYVNRPDLTAERFIPHPFGDPNARLYRTGDRVRYLPDGALEFLGRLDDQVKIRGVRVETGEVEAALRRHADVKGAAVVAREDVSGDRRLVAYVIAHAGTRPAYEEMRRFLRETLPEAMVPSAFVRLDAFPLGPNGKLDRLLLPAPAVRRPDLPDAFVAATTPVEEAIVQIWSDVLRVDPVGIHDDFFYLGGHSLLATQVMSRVNDAFGRNVPLRCLFELATVAGLAKAVADADPCAVDR